MMRNHRELHTVLGANGAMGRAVFKELQRRQLNFRLVSRKKMPGFPESITANLLNRDEAYEAVGGSQFVYLCVGLPYSTEVWKNQWKIIMQNMIDACAKYGAKLIFLDNVYMYSQPLPIPFDEQTAKNPQSNKGKIRKDIADMFLQAIASGKITGLIGRSADFYGEGVTNSILYISLLEKMRVGKRPLSLSHGKVKHTYANVKDNGRALVELALCEDCYGEVYHLPVSRPITLDEIVEFFNEELKTNFKLKVMPKIMLKLLSYFVPILRESSEMQYQFEQEYIMSSHKFLSRFPGFQVTPIEQGLKEMVNFFRKG
ncbi:NAD-dependent epimerase/dehydratase family protein [Rapidithrix thailandica]|uniref:NAD-dependent epimerase/dehydratase family protein n=1 Tax=Rapidithrix thailandica TaxID=413964 RepID=A0AAW9SDN3_9BACT